MGKKHFAVNLDAILFYPRNLGAAESYELLKAAVTHLERLEFKGLPVKVACHQSDLLRQKENQQRYAASKLRGQHNLGAVLDDGAFHKPKPGTFDAGVI
jgi:hypothetical protein